MLKLSLENNSIPRTTTREEWKLIDRSRRIYNKAVKMTIERQRDNIIHFPHLAHAVIQPKRFPL
jgi:hypothetical protein